MFFASKGEHWAGRRRWRLRLMGFPARRCLWQALRRITFPRRVTRKRFEALLLVFNFGMYLLLPRTLPAKSSQ